MTNNEAELPQGYTKHFAKEWSMRMDMQVRVCLKPKPRFLTERMWVRIASIFIRIEQTQPSFALSTPPKEGER